MPAGLLSPAQTLLWLLLTAVLGWLSRRSLANWRRHGFHRFFAFVACTLVVIPNLRYWHDQLFAPHQLLSWLLLFGALGLLLNSLYLLITRAGRRSKPVFDENFPFENTARLIDTGVYAYLRHPMYSALLWFTWGVWLKHPTWIGLAGCAVTSAALWFTALTEERENIAVFGEDYRRYMAKTRRFVPFLV